MNNNFKALGLVMGANVEALILLFAGHKVGLWLNSEYPRDGGWLKFTYLGAILMIGISWIKMFRLLVRKDSGDNSSTNED